MTDAEFDEWADAYRDVDDADAYLERLREEWDEYRAWAQFERWLDGEWYDDAYEPPVTKMPTL